MGQFEPQIKNVFELIDKNKVRLAKNAKVRKNTKEQSTKNNTIITTSEG